MKNEHFIVYYEQLSDCKVIRLWQGFLKTSDARLYLCD